MSVSGLTCCTAVIKARSSVGFHRPRSFTEAGAGGCKYTENILFKSSSKPLLYPIG